MNNRTVEAYKKILRSLLMGKMGVNAVLKQTSSDKKFAENILNSLIKGKLVEQFKDEKHKQKKNQSLTTVGFELAEIITAVENYKKAIEQLDQKIKSFSQIDDMNLDNKQGKLLAKGWTLEETKNYIPYVVDSNRLGYYVKRSLNELILYKYADINQKYTLNRIGKEIVYNVMISILNEYVQSLLLYFEGMKSFVLPFFNLRVELNNQIKRYNNRFIAPEISNLEIILDKLLETTKLTGTKFDIKKKFIKSEFQLLVKSELGERIKQYARELKMDESSLMDLMVNEALYDEN